jgi:hypothetical protein
MKYVCQYTLTYLLFSACFKNEPCRFCPMPPATARPVSRGPDEGAMADAGGKSQTDGQNGDLTVKSIKGGAVMGFLSGIFGPAHKQKNPEIRKEAAGRLTDKAVLAEMAEKDEDQGVREEAKKRLQALA